MSDAAFQDGDFADDERRILEILLDHDGTATTKQLEELTDLNSGQIYYRLDKLESGGWITVQEGSGSRDGPGRPPKEAVLTRRSLDLVDLDERAGAIVVAGGSEADVSVIREQLDAARGEIDAVSERIDDLAATLGDLADAIDGLDED